MSTDKTKDNISEHVTYKEAVYSNTAIRKNINNTPDAQQLRNMKLLANVVFEPLRAKLGVRAIKISSFFRSAALNKAIGGAKNSQHKTGLAMDIDNDASMRGPSNKEIFSCIRRHLVFDQLIAEFKSEENGGPAWVHVSYNPIEENRGQCLIATKVKDKWGRVRTSYKPFTMELYEEIYGKYDEK